MADPTDSDLPADLHRDRFYPLVKEAVSVCLHAGNVVKPVEVLVMLEVITPEQLDQWRHGGIPYLERAMTAGLARVGRILRVLRAHALEVGLVAVPARYARKGKGGKGRLRFSKSGDAAAEAAYACHFERPAKSAPQPSSPPQDGARAVTISEGKPS